MTSPESSNLNRSQWRIPLVILVGACCYAGAFSPPIGCNPSVTANNKLAGSAAGADGRRPSRSPSFAGMGPLSIRSSRARAVRRRASTLLMAAAPSSSLKPAAIPLMDSGKALARSGELLIDLTTEMGLYGGGLSAAGAQIRNAGDSVAQAAASCRFKTGMELVSDELREAGTCLQEASKKLDLAVREAQTDDMNELGDRIAQTVGYVKDCGEALEAAGAGIMQRSSISSIGSCLCKAGESFRALSTLIAGLDSPKDRKEAQVSGQRMNFASQKMILAGNELQGAPKPKPKGKSWLKGGL